METAGGILGCLFYAGTALLFLGAIGGRCTGNVEAWMRPGFWLTLAAGIGLVYGLPAYSLATIFWRLLTDREYGNG